MVCLVKLADALPRPLRNGQVRMKSNLSHTTEHDFFQALINAMNHQDFKVTGQNQICPHTWYTGSQLFSLCNKLWQAKLTVSLRWSVGWKMMMFIKNTLKKTHIFKALEHLRRSCWICLNMSVKFKESAQWYIFFLHSNSHSDGCLQSGSDLKCRPVSTNMNNTC